jgi:hypothetical protein
MYSPGRTLPTRKLPLIVPVPVLVEQAALPPSTAFEPGLEITHVASVIRKPEPVTSTNTPGSGTLAGLRVICGPKVTLKIAWANEPSFPVTWITYWPGRTFPTMKLPVTFPNPKNGLLDVGMKVEQPAPVMMPDVGLEIVQLVIVDRKYEPSMLTDVPIGPLAV